MDPQAQVIELVNKMNERMDEAWKKVESRQSTIEEELKKLNDQWKAIEEKERQARHALPDDSPLGDEGKNGNSKTGDALAQKGGWRKLGIDKALTIPTNHSIVRKEDAADLAELHRYHDAVVVKYWINWYKLHNTQTPLQIFERLTKDCDFQEYALLREKMGLGTDKEIRESWSKGAVNTGWDGDNFRKANEISHPYSGGVGNVLDFTLLSPNLIQKMRLDLVVASQFRRIPLQRASVKWPMLSADSMGVWGGTSATAGIPPKDTSSNLIPNSGMVPDTLWTRPTFSSVQFDVEHLLAYLVWNDDMAEQSIVDWVPLMTDQAAYAAARAYDRAVLDGDVTGTHMDDDVTGANDFRKAIRGIRKLSANHMVNVNAIFDIDDVHAIRALMGVMGVNPGDLRLFLNLKQWYQLVGAANIANATSGDILRRVDTIGDRATILTGQVGTVYGIPVQVSEFVRIDVNATGFNDATGNTVGVAVMANSRGFATGQFNEVRIETTRYAPVLVNLIQTDVRVDFQPFTPVGITSDSWTSTETNVPSAVGRNCL